MQFTIYSYWNMTELTNVFNAVAALVGGPDYGGALKFIVLVAVLSLALAVLTGRGRMDEFWQWTIMVALLNGFLLVPKATVQLVDQTGTNPPAVVSNVPIGLAALAGGISTIGYWLTTSYETVFALPGDLNFEANGMMFGQKVQQEINNLKPATVLWQNDFNNFYTQCVAPDLLSGALSQDQINTTSNIWGLLANTNPGLYVTISAGTMTCPNAYNNLNTRLTYNEVPATLQNYAATAVPQTASAALAVTKVGNTIVESDSYFNNLSVSANQAVQQGIVSNAIIDAHCNMLAQTSNTAMANECMTEEEGFRQTNSSYQSMANIAQSSMPKLRNAIELIQYAIFPIILIFVIVAGHKGLTVLKTYVMSLMWIQLWPPLYAVVNYMMNVHASYWANATQGNAMALQYQQWVSSASVSDQAIAGMLVLSIPAIAAAIVKGGDVGMQAVGNMVSPPHSVEKLAAQMAEGNFGAGKVNMAATAETGSPTLTQVNASGSQTIRNADGSSVTNAANSQDKLPFQATSSNATSSSYSTAATDSLKASQGNIQQAGTSLATALNTADKWNKEHGHGSDYTTGDGIAHTGGTDNSNQQVQSMVSDFAKTHKTLGRCFSGHR
jgi:conjugal transfer mating pair stabilization protein TraG